MTDMDLTNLNLFSGQRQFENFARFKTLLPTKKMAASASPYQFPDGSAYTLPQTYAFDGGDDRSKHSSLTPIHRPC